MAPGALLFYTVSLFFNCRLVLKFNNAARISCTCWPHQIQERTLQTSDNVIIHEEQVASQVEEQDQSQDEAEDDGGDPLLADF